MHARRLLIAFAAAALVALTLAGTALALTVRHDAENFDEFHEFGVTFRSVGWIEAPPLGSEDSTERCSAVLLTPDTAVTAAHCVTNNDYEIDVNVDQTFFYLGIRWISPQVQAPISSIEISEGWTCETCAPESDYRAGSDLAVLHFGTILHEPPLSRVYLGDVVGEEVAIVGYGALSTGLQSFDDFVASAQDGRKLAGTNVVDRVDDFGSEETSSHAWLFDFDSPSCDQPWPSGSFGPATSDICPTELEASYGFGDSGGPMFASIDGEWMLVGLSSHIRAPEGEFGKYGQIALVTNLSLDENRSLLDSAGLLKNAVIATATPSPTPAPTPTPTATATASPTPTATPTATPSPTSSPSPTPTSTTSPTVPAPSPTPTTPPSPTPTTSEVAPSPTNTSTPDPGEPSNGGFCSGGGGADAALLLLPLGFVLLVVRRKHGPA